jgi:hypothetical protein
VIPRTLQTPFVHLSQHFVVVKICQPEVGAITEECFVQPSPTCTDCRTCTCWIILLVAALVWRVTRAVWYKPAFSLSPSARCVHLGLPGVPRQHRVVSHVPSTEYKVALSETTNKVLVVLRVVCRPLMTFDLSNGVVLWLRRQLRFSDGPGSILGPGVSLF